MELAENPRARVGANGGPVDPDFDADFISARIIQEAAAYLQFRFGALEHIRVKRKGARPMSFRLVLAYSLRGIVPSESAARILDINRKTFGENQQRPEVWANHDSEEGRAFDRWLEHVSQAVYHHVSTNVPEFERLLAHFVALDVNLRKAEKLAKECRQAALEADQAADDLKRQARLKAADALGKTLKGVKNKAAIVAAQKGPAEIARALSDAGVAVVETLWAKEAKGERPPSSTLSREGLAECIKLGLARSAEPFLSKAEDPKIGPTGICGQVYLEAIALGRITKPKAKRAH